MLFHLIKVFFYYNVDQSRAEYKAVLDEISWLLKSLENKN